MFVCENHRLQGPRWPFAWVHGNYVQDPEFWENVRPIIAANL